MHNFGINHALNVHSISTARLCLSLKPLLESFLFLTFFSGITIYAYCLALLMSTLIIYLFSFRFINIQQCKQFLVNFKNCLLVFFVTFMIQNFASLLFHTPSSFVAAGSARVWSVLSNLSET